MNRSRGCGTFAGLLLAAIVPALLTLGTAPAAALDAGQVASRWSATKLPLPPPQASATADAVDMACLPSGRCVTAIQLGFAGAMVVGGGAS